LVGAVTWRERPSSPPRRQRDLFPERRYPEAWRPEARELQVYLDAFTRPCDDADLWLSLRAASTHPDLSKPARELAKVRMPKVEERLVERARKAGGAASFWLAPGCTLEVCVG
jgi:hypothetical protein